MAAKAAIATGIAGAGLATTASTPAAAQCVPLRVWVGQSYAETMDWGTKCHSPYHDDLVLVENSGDYGARVTVQFVWYDYRGDQHFNELWDDDPAFPTGTGYRFDGGYIARLRVCRNTPNPYNPVCSDWKSAL